MPSIPALRRQEEADLCVFTYEVPGQLGLQGRPCLREKCPKQKSSTTNKRNINKNKNEISRQTCSGGNYSICVYMYMHTYVNHAYTCFSLQVKKINT